MSNNTLHRILNYFIASVWIANGFFCKVLNLVPRHEQIVGRILGEVHSRSLTISIGFAEIVMSVWVLSGFRSRLNAITQIIIVATMNLLEFILVPDLLLWGKANSLFASLFIAVIIVNEFYWKKSSVKN